MITVVVNGETRQFAQSLTVAEYLAELGVEGRYTAVARNGEVLERDAFELVRIEDGDRVEVVRPVGGG